MTKNDYEQIGWELRSFFKAFPEDVHLALQESISDKMIGGNEFDLEQVEAAIENAISHIDHQPEGSLWKPSDGCRRCRGKKVQ